jgi:hypothetical protein
MRVSATVSDQNHSSVVHLGRMSKGQGMMLAC